VVMNPVSMPKGSLSTLATVARVSRLLDHDVNAKVFPWQLPGIPLGKHRDDVAVHRDAASIGSDRPRVSATRYRPLAPGLGSPLRRIHRIT
jgi:hypothetical protein